MSPVNKEDCPCHKKECPRYGDCNQCVPYHRDEKKDLPVCLRPLVIK